LCQEARRLATQPRRGGEGARLEADLAAKLRLSSVDRLRLQVQRSDAAGPLRSTDFPGDLALDQLPWERPADSAARERDPRPDRPGPAARRRGGDCALAGFVDASGDWRAALYDAPDARAFIAANLADTKDELRGALQSALALAVPVAIVLSVLGAWVLASLTLRPLQRLREAMKSLTRQDLSQRLPTHGEDHEFRALITAYNLMLERLDISFQQASRFSADAAHELKTPLTILQVRIERAISQAEGRAIQADLSEMLDEVGRLSAITRKLLLLAQADAGRMALQLTRVDLGELLEALVADARMVDDRHPIRGAIERELVIQGDAILLRQLCNNLIGNALRYCPAGGWIQVSARAATGAVEVVFANACSEIAESERARFFDRFYRGDPAHGRRIDGSGLGLSLAREIARAHAGDLRLLPSASDEVRLLLSLPTGAH
jgi:heavy metal sensor kinase